MSASRYDATLSFLLVVAFEASAAACDVPSFVHVDKHSSRDDERAHARRIRRSFSIASKETTAEQFQRYLQPYDVK